MSVSQVILKCAKIVQARTPSAKLMGHVSAAHPLVIVLPVKLVIAESAHQPIFVLIAIRITHLT